MESKGLEALKEYRNQQQGVCVHADDYLAIIEKELKQAEEDKETLDIFKNALTIERKPINNINAFKKDRESCISGLVGEIIEIKQNELDEKLRKSLREWVLKNAFPKELKALEIITNLFDIKIIGDYLIAQKGDVCIVENLKLRQSQEIINLLKEVLL